jgi:hypothetical protein
MYTIIIIRAVHKTFVSVTAPNTHTHTHTHKERMEIDEPHPIPDKRLHGWYSRQVDTNLGSLKFVNEHGTLVHVTAITASSESRPRYSGHDRAKDVIYMGALCWRVYD